MTVQELIKQSQVVRYRWKSDSEHVLWSCDYINDEDDVDFEIRAINGECDFEYDLDIGAYYYKLEPNGNLTLLGIVTKEGVKSA